MYSKVSIEIAGDIDIVWELASAVERWPVLLPHYRYVRTVQVTGPRRTLAMSAKRGWLPVRWVATIDRFPASRRIEFEHVGGAARGMRVEWRIEPIANRVRATIMHELVSPYWLLRTRAGEYILGEHFVAAIAGRTLRRIKYVAETLSRTAIPARAGTPQPRLSRPPGTRATWRP